MKKKKKDGYDPEWANAKNLCRLNQEDIKMAKELGMSPRSLIKNIPSKTQPWKVPVKYWIRGLYEKRQERLEGRKLAKVRKDSPSETNSLPDANKNEFERASHEKLEG